MNLISCLLHRLHTLLRFCQSNIVSLIIVFDKFAPKGFLRQFTSMLATGVNLFLIHRRKNSHSFLDVISHLRVIIVGTMNNLHAIFQLTIMTKHRVGPKTETCQIGCDSRNLESNCL